MKWLSKLFKTKEYRQGYSDFLHNALEECVLNSSHDYLTPSYVAHQLYLEWVATGHLDTSTPFAQTVKLFDRDRAYSHGAVAAFDEVWQYIYLYNELYHTRDLKDAF